MPVVQDIRAEVHDLANKSTDKIVLITFASLINKHGSHYRGDCHCEHCEKLSEYIRLKQWICVLNRADDEVENSIANGYLFPNDFSIDITDIRRHIKHLKQERQNIKNEAIKEVLSA